MLTNDIWPFRSFHSAILPKEKWFKQTDLPKTYFEVKPVTGGHRRAALFSPEVQEKHRASNPEPFERWSNKLISEKVWDDPHCDLILCRFSYFDNMANSEPCKVESTDVECMLTIWRVLEANPAKYVNWSSQHKSVVDKLLDEIVCIFFI